MTITLEHAGPSGAARANLGFTRGVAHPAAHSTDSRLDWRARDMDERSASINSGCCKVPAWPGVPARPPCEGEGEGTASTEGPSRGSVCVPAWCGRARACACACVCSPTGASLRSHTHKRMALLYKRNKFDFDLVRVLQ